MNIILVKNANIVWGGEKNAFLNGLYDIKILDGIIDDIVASSEDAFLSFDGEVIDLNGSVVLPAFFDSHIHPLGKEIITSNLLLLKAEDNKSIEVCVNKIKEYVDNPKNQNLNIITGAGWMDSLFMAHNVNNLGDAYAALGPSATILDNALKGTSAEHKPVYIISFDRHSVWVNSVALKMADMLYNPQDVDIYSGKIEINPDDGKAWGCLREGAIKSLYDRLPKQNIPTQELEVALAKFEQSMLERGVAGVSTASNDPMTLGYDLTCGDAYDLMAEKDAKGELKLFYDTMAYIGPLSDVSAVISRLKSLQQKHLDSNKLRFGTIKIFVDGVVEGGTASMLNEAGNADEAGLIWGISQLNKAVSEVDASGLQIHFHAIGDGAVKITLDVIKNAFKQNGKRDARHTLAHIQTIDDKDVKRLSELGVVACLQPYWFYKEVGFFDTVEKAFLKEKAESEYPYNSFIKEGIIISGGSDYPATPNPNPLVAIEIGVTRNLKGAMDKSCVLNYEERGTVANLISSFTYGGAYQAHVENKMGSIAIGMRANFVVLSENPFECESSNIHKIKIIATLVDGKIVYKQ